MKKYQCHKQVYAAPMTRGEYNKYRGWTVPADEDPNEEGYIVYYNHGTPREYVSWSPKDVFDEGYTEIEDTADE